jgi:hypothetical protein
VPFRLVQAPRKLRVIYMEGTGGEEYRWIRDALQEDKDIECVAMIADQQYVQRPRLVRVGDYLSRLPRHSRGTVAIRLRHLQRYLARRVYSRAIGVDG